jgi:hypothetical protein
MACSTARVTLLMTFGATGLPHGPFISWLWALDREGIELYTPCQAEAKSKPRRRLPPMGSRSSRLMPAVIRRGSIAPCSACLRRAFNVSP